MVTVIILTYNEQIHIERTLINVSKLTDDIVIVDSFSTDKTQEICERYGTRFFQNPFINQAEQMNWAIDNVPFEKPWIFRLDADEYLTDELIEEIKTKIPTLEEKYTGVFLKRRVYFQDKWIKRGGYYPTWILRLWRNGYGRVEQKWMDEHILLSSGETTKFEHDFIDDNLNNLTWWTAKHNNYATREAAEALNKKYNFLEGDNIEAKIDKEKQDSTKRWFKENIYGRVPMFVRPMFYFFFRYCIKLGFLDGKQGLIWHFLQGFWYRFLVDAKVDQIETIAKKENRTVKDVLVNDFKMKL